MESQPKHGRLLPRPHRVVFQLLSAGSSDQRGWRHWSATHSLLHQSRPRTGLFAEDGQPRRDRAEGFFRDAGGGWRTEPDLALQLKVGFYESRDPGACPVYRVGRVTPELVNEILRDGSKRVSCGAAKQDNLNMENLVNGKKGYVDQGYRPYLWSHATMWIVTQIANAHAFYRDPADVEPFREAVG
jgi:hypothetical protein